MRDYSKKAKQNYKNITKITTIKIIAGKFRGKILNATLLQHTRPTKAIVKESVFNTIAPFIKDKIFIEVFAGYGSMGFEALSRGAKKVIFLEKDKQSFTILQNNIALFSKALDELELSKIEARNVDSFKVLDEILHEFLNKSVIFYFDPPFGESGEYYKRIFEILESLCLNKDLSKKSIDLCANLSDKILIFEHISSFVMPTSIANLKYQKYKKFGKTSISYYFMA